jgi:outer membrane protein OmpA-like peptidoglycan-associated protein
MNALRNRLQVTCFGILVSACTIPQQNLPEPIPTFSHSTPIREVHSSTPLQRRIQPAVVYFANDSHDITPHAKKNLAEFLDQLIDTSWPSIVIEGHTDANDSEDYNLNLAKRRTKSVKETLMRIGYPGHQMIELAKGEIQPIASNATASGRQLNRRVVIKLYQTSEQSNVMTVLKHRLTLASNSSPKH